MIAAGEDTRLSSWIAALCLALAVLPAPRATAAEAVLGERPAGDSVEDLDSPLEKGFEQLKRLPPLLPGLRERLRGLDPFFADTWIGGRLRSYYFRRDLDDNLNEAATLGAWLHYESGWFRERLKLGAELYTSLKLYGPSERDGTYAAALVDVDADGDADLVFGGWNRLYLNDGTGTFTDASAARMPVGHRGSNAVAPGDVDGDGDPDLVFGSHGQNRLYFNLLRQLATSFMVIPGREYRLEAYARYGVPRAVDAVLPFVSTATARIPLPPLGTLGLDPTLMIALPPFVIPQPAGMNSVSVVLPDDPNLVGVTIYAQALLVQHPVHSLLTNLTADRIVR